MTVEGITLNRDRPRFLLRVIFEILPRPFKVSNKNGGELTGIKA